MGGIRDILYVRFSVAELDQQETFLKDFGLLVTRDGEKLFARGTDGEDYVYCAEKGAPKFLGMGFEAETEADLRRIAAIDGARVVNSTRASGGLITTLVDPDGFEVDIVYGTSKPEPLPIPSRSPLNRGDERLRIGSRAQIERTAQTIKRLGHCVLGVQDFANSKIWYQQRLGLIVSDEIYAGEETNVIGAFLRCNRGEIHVDHHTLFLLGGPNPGFNHAAFEIADWDSLMEGHYELARAGYTHSWGVGKHLLGSQVFDYWKDPHGFVLEHFTDGDLLNESFGSHKAPIEQLLGSFWGPKGSPT